MSKKELAGDIAIFGGILGGSILLQALVIGAVTAFVVVVASKTSEYFPIRVQPVTPMYAPSG